MKIGWDLDGVLFDFAASVERYLKSIGVQPEFNICEATGECADWHFYRPWIDDKQFVKYCNDGADAGYVFDGPPRAGAVQAVRAVAALGHTNHAITDRFFGSVPEISHATTKRWIEANKFPFDSLTFSADKTSVKTDMYIEDKLENYDALEAAGVEVYLLNRPWNRVAGDSRRRIETLQDYVNAVTTRTYREQMHTNAQQLVMV